MRGPTLSRDYTQCDLATKLEDWPDERFWGTEGAVSTEHC
jgi:hypothetical protein